MMETEGITGTRKETLRRWIWVIVFAIGFAWVESSIVVYLRDIYYEGSFDFPIIVKWEDGKHVLDYIMRIELGREIATILMLIAIACVAGRNAWQKFSYFMIAFGIWDIFYYVWLRVMIGWPESLMTWDILFLMPLVWVGPVITPLLIAIAMAVAGSLIVYYDEKGVKIRVFWYDWVIIFGCGLIMIVAFCWDWKNIIQVPDCPDCDGLPNPFLWELYLPAFIFSVVYFGIRLRKIVSSQIDN